MPLNALDENQFRDVVSHFPEGELVIVNEGLLMYLNTEEKEKLCRIIHAILSERGGYWITADIYIKNRMEGLKLNIDSKTKEFFEQHRIEENKFESFEEAENFFMKMGFTAEREARVERAKLSSRKYLLKSLTMKDLFTKRKVRKMQATWRLRLVTD